MALADETLPDAGIDPETMLKAEQAFDSKYSQIGAAPSTPAPTEPPPFVADAAPPPSAIAAPAAAPPPTGPGDQTLLLDQSAPAPAPPSAGPAGAEVSPAPPPELGPPPKGPALTGDPTKDAAANLQWHRDLTAYQDQVNQHGAALGQKQAELGQKKADRELQLEQNAATVRNDEAKRFAEENAARRQAIDKAVSDRTAAYQDLSKGNGFLDQSLGDKVMGAIIFMLGSRQQALTNVAMIQSGHAPTAQNEGLNYIDRLMQTRYEQKKQRLAAANDSVLEARYGFKDALENHHAAMADLDADAAANYRLAAKEAASQAAQLGTEEARQAGLQASTALQQKAAEYEGKMLKDQQELQEKREAAAANNALAGAHLNLSERQAIATENQHKEVNYEHKREFDLKDQERRDALAAAAEAKRAKQKDADEKEIVRDETGKPTGRVPTGRGGAQGFATRDADYGRAEQQMQALLDDIKTNGARPLTPDAIRRRQTLEQNAAIGVATVSPLGKTDEAMKAESASIGAHGTGVVAALKGAALGANQAAIERKLAEVREQRNRYRQETLRPLGDEPVPQAHTSDKAEPPAKAGKAPKLTGDDALQMMQFHKQGDHRFDALLKANGLL